MLVAHNVCDERVHGWDAVRGERYRCPECGADLVVKQGQIKVWHFAHQPGPATCARAGETLAHLAMKEFVYRALRDQPWARACDVEVPLFGQRLDVWLSTDWEQIAFECQVSPLEVEELQAKLAAYARHEIYCAYIVHAGCLPAPDRRGEMLVPAWIRALHDLCGRIYLYDEQAGLLRAAVFAQVQRWRDRFYDPETGFSGGGYRQTLAATRRVTAVSLVDPATVMCRTVRSRVKELPGVYFVAEFGARSLQA